ncbi:MAG: hypothetical protein P1U63_04120 [Coxiellaceae bacterium]|nr:hypothetical protein [Coxiellaceae bacterium]
MRLFRWCGAGAAADAIKKEMDKLAEEAIRTPLERDDDDYARRLERLQQRAGAIILENGAYCTIDQCSALLNRMVVGNPYGFMQVRQPGSNRPEHYCVLVQGMQAHVVNKFLLKHPYRDGQYATGKHNGTVTAQQTLQRIEASGLMRKELLAPTAMGGRIAVLIGVTTKIDSLHRLHFEQLKKDVAAKRAPTTLEALEAKNHARMVVR